MRRHPAPARVPVLAAAGVLVIAACTDADPGTTPYAHESPPWPASPVEELESSRYLGGSGPEVVDDLALAPFPGVHVVVGGTGSADFPTTDGSTPVTTAPVGCAACPLDATIVAVDASPTATAPRWARVLAGPGYDRATAVAATDGAVFVAGSTGGELAVTAAAGDRTFAGGASAERGAEDGFVCRLDASTGATTWCTYVGGSGPGGVSDLAYAEGTLVVAFTTGPGEDLHLDPDYAAAFAGRARATAQGGDGVLLRLDPTTGGFLAATYVGGSGDEAGTPSVHASGAHVHYLGATASSDVPTPRGWRTTAPTGPNLFLASLDEELMAQVYGTYVGGDGADEASGNALAGDGTSLIVGITTTSRDLPVGVGATQPTYGGDGGPGCGTGDVWIAAVTFLSTGADTISAGTYLGGSAGERLGGIHWSGGGFGSLMVTGQTLSSDFPFSRGAQPALAGAPCTTSPGNADAFVTELDFARSARASTYLGGAAFDRGAAVVGLGDRTVTVAGDTASADFPVRGPGDASLGGASDGFLATLGAASPTPWPPPGDGGLGDGNYGDYVYPEDVDGAGGCGCGSSAPSPGASLALFGLGLAALRRRRPARP